MDKDSASENCLDGCVLEPMKKKVTIFLATALLLIAAVFARRQTFSAQISVTFLGYTNVDSRGISQPFTLALFRIENRSGKSLSCQQGVRELEVGGKWIQETNRIGFQYDPILEPKGTLILSMAAPTDVTRWRSSFLITQMHGYRYVITQNRLSILLDHVGLHWQRKPDRPYIITSETIER